MTRPACALLAATCLLALLITAAAAVGALLGIGPWTAVLALYLIAIPAATIALTPRRDRS